MLHNINIWFQNTISTVWYFYIVAKTNIVSTCFNFKYFVRFFEITLCQIYPHLTDVRSLTVDLPKLQSLTPPSEPPTMRQSLFRAIEVTPPVPEHADLTYTCIDISGAVFEYFYFHKVVFIHTVFIDITQTQIFMMYITKFSLIHMGYQQLKMMM